MADKKTKLGDCVGEKVHALSVVLDNDIPRKDAELLMGAIKMMKHVVGVGVNVVSLDDFSARTRMKHELFGKIIEVFQESEKDE
jgi:hypothetical protein